MNWYVLMVKTGQEHKASKEIENSWKMKDVLPFIPMKESYFRKAKQLKKETEIMFPSYVFVESEIHEKEFSTCTLDYIKRSQAILKLLRYDGSNEIAIRENECAFLKSILNEKYCVESSKGIIKGDNIIITEGVFAGRESIIVKINRHKMQAIVEMEFMGGIRLVTIGLEILKKLQ